MTFCWERRKTINIGYWMNGNCVSVYGWLSVSWCLMSLWDTKFIEKYLLVCKYKYKQDFNMYKCVFLCICIWDNVLVAFCDVTCHVDKWFLSRRINTNCSWWCCRNWYYERFIWCVPSPFLSFRSLPFLFFCVDIVSTICRWRK